MSRWLSKLCLQGALAVAGSAGACTTPSVPIPPPEPEKVFFALDLDLGEASFRYDASQAYSNAVVYIFNRDVGEGIITTAEDNGEVLPTEPFPAFVGDDILITFETEAQLSTPA